MTGNSEQRIALLTFHRDWPTARSRVNLLRAMNPGVPVHGLFGGDPAEFQYAAREVGPVLDTLQSCTLGDGRWRWQHTDLVIRDWYARGGHRLAFSVLHVMQWDLLLFDSFSRLYGHVPHGAVALTGMTPTATIADRWHWTTVEPHRTETASLFTMAREVWGYEGTPTACLGPGTTLPRTFLEFYAERTIPELGHDEVRFPLFAEIFGLPLVDTGFYPRWFDAESERLFNANGTELPIEDVRAELMIPGGRRSFHPCREAFSDEIIAEFVTLASRFRPSSHSD